MNKSLSSRDIETLSAYLDQQLGSDEQARLQKRLQSEAMLRETLHELEQTRQLIRSVPQLRAPRNFTLSPEMAGIRTNAPRQAIFPAFRLAFAIASIFLIMVLFADFWAGSQLATPAEPMLEMAVEQEVAEEEAAADQIVELTAPVEMEPLALEPAPSPLTEAAESALAPQESASSMPTDAGVNLKALPPPGSVEETPGLEMKTIPPEATLTPGVLGESAPAGMGSLPEATPGLGEITPEVSDQLPEEQAALQAEAPAPLEREQAPVEGSDQRLKYLPDRQTLRIIELVLLVLAVLAGIAALATRRARK